MHLYGVGQWFYRGTVAKIADAIGLTSWYKQRLLSRMDTYTLSISGSSAEFFVESEPELFHIKNNTSSEIDTITDFVHEIEPGDVVYDIGSNIGVYACLAGVSNENVEVVAFEPFPANARRIEENTQLNEIDVDVKEIALSDENGKAEFHVDGRDGPGSGMGSLYHEDGETITISTHRGDSLIKEGLPSPSIVKIDVEGAELEVIAGLNQALSDEKCRAAYVEIHPRYVTPDDVSAKLREYGFEVTDIETVNRNHLKATK